MMLPIIVTIDGPAGTGKSSAASQLADRLGFDMLDTGAMYRAVALLAVEQQIDPHHEFALAVAMDRATLDVDFSSRPPTILLDKRDVRDRIRDADVNVAVSVVARQPALRAAMVEAQRVIGRAHPRLVTEGRDQGSVVFPDAVVRFYLDAHPEVRARRRVDQMRAQGRPADYEAVLRAIQQRDHLDETRVDGPLVCAPGAQRIDTSGLTLDQVVLELESRTRVVVPADFLTPSRAVQTA